MIYCWDKNSPFQNWLMNRIRIANRRWPDRDCLEAFPEIWIGLNANFSAGQTLTGRDLGLASLIVSQRILNYFSGKVGRIPWQLRRTLGDHPEAFGLAATVKPPDELSADRELIGMIETKLSEMPWPKSSAVRAEFGYPGVPCLSEIARISGTTRQNISKHREKALRKLRLHFARASR